MGIPAHVRPLLRQHVAAGPPRRGARRPVRPLRHRRNRRGLHDADALYGRRVERLDGTTPRAGAPELPARIPRRHDGQLVPATGYGAGQRRGEGGALRARGLPRRTASHETMASARDGLCPADARRSRPPRLERVAQGDSAQLDRPLGGCAGLFPDPRAGRKT